MVGDLATLGQLKELAAEPMANLGRLVRAGRPAGVQVILCGQTAMSRNLPRNVVSPKVTFAWSAMVAHMALEREGFVLNPF